MRITNLKIRTRLILGFGIIVLLLSLSLFLSKYTITTLIDKMGSVVSTYDIMTNIKQREIDHLDWVMAVNKGIINKSLPELEVQTDYHKCKFGIWFYSDESKKAEKEIPEIAQYLLKIEEPHKKLHESVIDMKKTNDIESLKIFNVITLPNLEIVRSNMLLINAAAIQATNRNVKNSDALFSKNKLMLVVISIFTLVLSLIISIVITKSITSQLGGEPVQLITAAKSLSNGDFTVDIKVEDGDTSSVLAYMKVMVNNNIYYYRHYVNLFNALHVNQIVVILQIV